MGVGRSFCGGTAGVTPRWTAGLSGGPSSQRQQAKGGKQGGQCDQNAMLGPSGRASPYGCGGYSRQRRGADQRPASMMEACAARSAPIPLPNGHLNQWLKLADYNAQPQRERSPERFRGSAVRPKNWPVTPSGQGVARWINLKPLCGEHTSTGSPKDEELTTWDASTGIRASICSPGNATANGRTTGGLLLVR